ncbi:MULTISPECIES: YkgJ family cysteine cluster protein [Methanoculleus]|jgi:Fe-S-cluster containining protein|uniref:Zinc-or iron-chelating domain-containing protein n=2 Tax=Methanoculleus thermophilus TaxID=2200 RepID=A0A1G8X9S2_9EURY|nr:MULTISPECIES: YkgJ family cysteine cluster protein [Methanoculleus]SDJ87056.1 Putative zinc-or iron-chelating domain-containing protein [Methanoculleus thermophilus]HQD26574.1 YkgJ family cysteine cluster protein [Methanoculleus thermophilus]
MTAFECSLCGKCCMHAGGQLIEVEKQLTSRDFLCRQKIVGGTFRARVEERFLDAFMDRSENRKHPSWCPFLRPLPGEMGKYVCTIHNSRPLVCRSYTCCAMRIFAGDGREVGKVKGRRSLVTEDAALQQCWNESIAPLMIESDTAWRAKVSEVLGRAGYRVEAYE